MRVKSCSFFLDLSDDCLRVALFLLDFVLLSCHSVSLLGCSYFVLWLFSSVVLVCCLLVSYSV